jgi:hypothetical protein
MSDVFDLAKPHPYGAKPSANLFLCDDGTSAVRSRGLGVIRRLGDVALLELLGFLDGQTLARVLCVSRTLYAFGHHNDIWRDLVLRSFPSFSYDRTWKDTFAQTFAKHAGGAAVPVHSPIRMSGVFSDALHRPWCCRSYELKPEWLKLDNLPRRSKLSVEEFLAEYEVPNKPVVLTDVVNQWPAFKNWEKPYLIENGDKQRARFRTTSTTCPVAADFSVEQYLLYAEQAQEETPLYLFERGFARKAPGLAADYEEPPYFHPDAKHGTDLFRLLGSRRPDHKWLIMGPARSGSIFHVDPNSTNAWNAAIRGRKRWILYPPGSVPPGVIPSSNLADITVPLSLGEWYLNFWEEHRKSRRDLPPHMRPVEGTVGPGEMIFVPNGWWHNVLNLDDAVAVTHNYVSSSNLKNVLRFLSEKSDQITGVRDRSKKAVTCQQVGGGSGGGGGGADGAMDGGEASGGGAVRRHRGSQRMDGAVSAAAASAPNGPESGGAGSGAGSGAESAGVEPEAIPSENLHSEFVKQMRKAYPALLDATLEVIAAEAKAEAEAAAAAGEGQQMAAGVQHQQGGRKRKRDGLTMWEQLTQGKPAAAGGGAAAAAEAGAAGAGAGAGGATAGGGDVADPAATAAWSGFGF